MFRQSTLVSQRRCKILRRFCYSCISFLSVIKRKAYPYWELKHQRKVAWCNGFQNIIWLLSRKPCELSETDPLPYCFSTVGRDVVMVTILRDLLIRVAQTLEYPARVSKNAWVEAVVFSWKESKHCHSDSILSWRPHIGKKCGGTLG